MRRRKSAVSEIIGTILILSLTVVLFAAIFYFVSTLPPPAGQSNSQFTAVLGVSNGGTEAFVNITYVAGPILTAGNTPIYLSSSAHPADYTCARNALGYGDPYTTTQGLVGAPTTWSAGQIWSLHLVIGATVCPGGGSSLNAINPPDNITISILSLSRDTLLFHVSLPGTSPSLPPTFYNYGVLQASPGATNSYEIYTSISGSVQAGSVLATYSDIPLAPGSPQAMTLNAQGQYVLTVAGGVTAPVPGSAYSFVVQATGTNGEHNSVVFYYTFPSAANSALLSITVTPSVGSPVVRQAVVFTVVVTNNGVLAASGVCVSLNWSDIKAGSSGAITISGSACDANPLFSGTSFTVLATWTAGPKGDGDYTIIAVTNGGVQASLSMTVFPRTLVIDETGVAQGSNASTDTFTYLETAFGAADIPFNTTVVPPGSSVIGWDCAAPTCLNNYDVVIWLLSNTGTLSPTDMANLVLATSGSTCSPACPGDRSVWLLGANAVTGASASLLSALGITAGTSHSLGSAASPTYPALTVTSAGIPAIPDAGVVLNNLYLNGWLGGQWSQPNYQTISPNTGLASTYISAPAGSVAVGYNTTWKALSMPMELSTTSMTLPWCTPPAVPACNYQPSLGQQASIAYDSFNWLANLTMPGLPTHRSGNDWAVSEVDVQPYTLSFNTPAWVNVTVRDNGPSTATVNAELTVDGVPLYVGGSPVITQATPAAFGGITRFSFNWTPSYIGYLSIGVCILPPTSDLDAANNCMNNNLFAVQLYVHYNVLLVDGTLHSSVGTLSDTTPYVYSALTADGFPTSTITNATIATTCGSLPAATQSALTASPPHYNLVVWNLGDTTNATGCPLNAVDASTLESFLNNGGGSSSLIMLGNGLLSDSGAHANGPINSFLGTYLGIMPSSITALPTPPGQDVYGAVNNPVGDGAQIVYGPASNNLTGAYGFTSLNWTPNLYKQVSMYYSDTDFWTLSNPYYGAGTNSYSTAADWHTTYLALNPDRLGEYGMTGALRMAILRAATFSGRLLPDANAVVASSGITFATASAEYTNFDAMHPQLEQQYLVDTNVTNVGGSPAYSVGLQVYDGSHILATSSVTVGPASASANENVTSGTGSLSTSWTPLYASTQAIRVVITTSTLTAGILPGVGQSGQWNVTVYFFYDDGGAGENVWSHNQLMTFQTTQDPSCVSTLTSNSTFYFAGHSNIPQEWPLGATTTPAQGYYYNDPGYTNGNSMGFVDYPTANDACSVEWPSASTYTKGYPDTFTNYYASGGSCPNGLSPWVKSDLFGENELYCPTIWGINRGVGSTPTSTSCYLITASYLCAAMSILDTSQNPNYVSPWTFSSAAYIPADTSSAEATFWSSWFLSYAYSGVVTCVEYSATQGGAYTGANGGNGAGNTPSCSAAPSGSAAPTPSPGYTTTVPSGAGCTNVAVFSGSSAGGTGNWQLETLNLTAYAGYWVKIGFDYLEGNSAGCGGTAPTFSGTIFQVNGLNVQATDNAQTSLADAITYTTGTAGTTCTAPSTPTTPDDPQYVPNDLWHSVSDSQLPSGFNTSLPAGMKGAWVASIPTAHDAGYELDGNMWDQLYTRQIDLTSAATAVLSFDWVANVDNANYNPSMGLSLYISPTSSSGQFNWVLLWQSGTAGAGWNYKSLSLSNYVGQVVELEWIAGTNCGQVTYPYTGAFLVGDVKLTGTTIISAGPVGISAPAAHLLGQVVAPGTQASEPFETVAPSAGGLPGGLTPADLVSPPTAATQAHAVTSAQAEALSHALDTQRSAAWTKGKEN